MAFNDVYPPIDTVAHEPGQDCVCTPSVVVATAAGVFIGEMVVHEAIDGPVGSAL